MALVQPHIAASHVLDLHSEVLDRRSQFLDLGIKARGFHDGVQGTIKHRADFRHFFVLLNWLGNLDARCVSHCRVSWIWMVQGRVNSLPW
jgi:hypothetical protein